MTENNENKNKVDVIVVGAGPAGVSAAITVARGGKSVVLVERANYAGAKNMYGGVIYSHAAKEIFPDYKEAPIERFVSKHSYVLLGDDDSTEITYKNPEHYGDSFVAIRAKWDKWCVEQAVKEGVYFAPNTLVKELIVQDGQVKGIVTDLEEYYADIVILADGVNSLLAKELGLRKELETKDVALSVKEVIKLDKETINQRFNLTDDEGAIGEIFGGPMLGTLSLGFMYTNTDSVTIGLGVTLNDLVEKNYRPFELLDQLKSHPTIAPLIEGGTLKEYSAHLIPEGGYKKIPKLCDNGVMIVGDAGMLVNNLHWEGTNLAMISGKLAAETAIEALDCKNYSKRILSKYEKKLKNSFVLKDLETYKELMDTFHKRQQAFLDYYLRKINAFFEMFTSVNSIPKRENY